jgi:hypothetical protein
MKMDIEVFWYMFLKMRFIKKIFKKAKKMFQEKYGKNMNIISQEILLKQSRFVGSREL